MAADTEVVLLYDHAREIWMDLPYNDLRVLCATSRASTSLNLAAYRELCNDPEAWITRAHRKLDVDPQLFWERSPIEAALPLPGDTEGRRAQMRYVEIVSRGSGAVLDSVYFISPYEVLVRAHDAGDDQLFNQALEMTKKLKLNERDLDKARSYVIQTLMQSRQMTTREGKDRFYRFAPDYAIQRMELYADPLYKGLLGQITTGYSTNRKSFLDPGKSLQSSSAVTKKENLLGILIRNDVTLLQRIFLTPMKFIDTWSQALMILFASNNVPLIEEALQIHPELHDAMHNDWESKIILGRIKDPEILRLFIERIPQAMDFLAPDRYSSGVLNALLHQGNFEVADELMRILDLQLEFSDAAILLEGPYGLKIAEWLLRYGYDIRNYNLDLSGLVISNAVRAYYEGRDSK